MKIKKHTESVFDALKSVADRKGNILNTFISLDTAGNMIIDGTVGHINYSDMKISVDVSSKIKGDELFMESYKISKNFRLNYKDNSIHVILDKNKLEQHYLMYLIGILIKIKEMVK